MVSRRLSLLSLLAVAALVIPAGLAAAQTPPANTGPTKMGTVNVNKVLNEIQEMKDLRVMIESQVRAVQDEQKRRQRILEDIRGQLVILSPGSADYKKKADEFMAKGVELEVYMRMQQAELTRVQKEQMSNLFKKVEEASAKLAKADGLDLVVVETRPDLPPADFEKMTPEQLAAWMSQRTILYRAEKLDLTSKVVAELDAGYKKKP